MGFMTRTKRIRTLGLALGALLVVAALGVAGYSLQHATHPAQASGSGGGYCVVPAGGGGCHFKGFTAAAFYASVDTTTCATGVVTDYSVYAAENVQHGASAIATSSDVMVSYSHWDTCTGDSVYYYGEAPDATIKTSGNLGSATAQATVPMQDWYNNAGPTLSVNVTWTGYGDISTVVDASTSRNGSSVYKMRTSGSNRMAIVSGTISDGTNTYTLNSTSSMNDSKGGDMVLQHA